MINLDILGTEAYYNNWTSSSTGWKLNEVANYTEDEWNKWIAFSDDKYEISISRYSDYSISVPESEISSTDYKQRYKDIHNYLDAEWYRYDTDYTAATIVLDYYDDTDAPFGQASNGHAGQERIWGIYEARRVVWVNMGKYPVSDTSYHNETKYYGTCVHELEHQFSAEHTDGNINSDNTGSFIVPTDGDKYSDMCVDVGSAWERDERFSTCEQSTIKDYADEHVV